jgi:geranylgeranyl diphosphate synthase, type II
MDSRRRIDRALKSCLDQATALPCPPRLGDAMRHAVFPGGARFRPEFCLAVAGACGDVQPLLTDAAAAAIELLHCASLVYDDLPCFDDAAVRRGHATVHAAFGEELARSASTTSAVTTGPRPAPCSRPPSSPAP